MSCLQAENCELMLDYLEGLQGFQKRDSIQIELISPLKTYLSPNHLTKQCEYVNI